MGSKRNVYLAIITTIIGFMLAVQFRTVSEPKVRDTRDTWELREDLMEAKEIQSQLLKEISSIEDKLVKYRNEKQSSKAEILKETLEELKGEAGLTDITGPGVVISLAPAAEIPGFQSDRNVSPYLLKRLLNELYLNGALHVSIDGKRVINTTVIREISMVTKIDGHSLNKFPIEIKAIAADQAGAEKLYDRMKVSAVIEDFFIDNLKVSLDNPESDIVVPAYQNPIRIRYMEPVNADEGGGS